MYTCKRVLPSRHCDHGSRHKTGWISLHVKTCYCQGQTLLSLLFLFVGIFHSLCSLCVCVCPLNMVVCVQLMLHLLPINPHTCKCDRSYNPCVPMPHVLFGQSSNAKIQPVLASNHQLTVELLSMFCFWVHYQKI